MISAKHSGKRARLTAVLFASLVFIRTGTPVPDKAKPASDGPTTSSVRMDANAMGRMHAPEFPEDFAWINTDRPLRLQNDLKGRVVLLDFWTYCCINCMHVLPDLEYLEKKYAGQPFIVIGVHSNKFDNEASPANVRTAVMRYGIDHPVIVDEKMRIWHSYSVHAWPTLAVIDPAGRIAWMASGEGHRDELDRLIGGLLEESRDQGALTTATLTINRQGMVRSTSGLLFPGKVLADAKAKRFFVADSNHNRIVAAGWPDAEGRAPLLALFGSGAQGTEDGPADKATFNKPQGMALSGEKLYVADTENHLIRLVDLAQKSVTTVLGTGKQSEDREGGKIGREQAVSSPWDLLLDKGSLYIAMAGLHEIWRMNVSTGDARAVAGSGVENLEDGLARKAALAQPSGLAILDDVLYFADSEVSAVRGLDLLAKRVFTLIGKGLFVFGDVDGDTQTGRLQHPLGVATYGRDLLVADSYNHKIRIVDPAARTIRAFLGTGKPSAGNVGGDVGFYEPGGLSVAGDTLLVADTNNHRVVMVDLKTRAWREVMIEGLSSPEPPGAAPALQTKDAVTTRVAVALNPATSVTLELQPTLPAETHLTPDAPVSVRLSAGGATLVQRSFVTDKLPVSVLVDAATVARAKDSPEWKIEMFYGYCTTGNKMLCIPASVTWILGVQFGADQKPGAAIRLR